MKPDAAMRHAWRWTVMALLPWSGGAGAADEVAPASPVVDDVVSVGSALTGYAVCPVASPDDRLDVAIAAGKTKYAAPH